MSLTTIWKNSFFFFALCSLSSMAGMGIGTGLFSFVTLWVIAKNPEIRSRARQFLLSRLGLVSLAFFLVAAASLIAAALFPPLSGALPGFKELAKFHYFLLPFWVALALVSLPGEMEESSFFCFLAYAGFFNFFLALAQFFARDLFPLSWLDAKFFRQVGTIGATVRYHAQGIMFFHLSFASCMCFVGAMGLGRTFFPRAKDSWKSKVFWLLVGIAGALAAFYSYSRIAWVAVLSIPVLLAILKRPRWGVVTILIACGLASLTWKLSDSLRHRWDDSVAGYYHREQMWIAAAEMAKDRPILGVGFGRTGFYSEAYSIRALGFKPEFVSHAHNNFLDIAAAMGGLGLLVFVGWWGLLFFMAWRSFRPAHPDQKWLPAAAIAGLVAFHINGLTQVNFWDGKSQHTLMLWVGVVVATYYRQQLVAKSSSNRL